jgi:DNA-directed RNA polymerase specialized sigma24 family protein
LSTYQDLVARAGELHHTGHGSAAIAEILNQEGWRPAKRRDTFNAPMVRHLLLKAGVAEVKYRRRKPELQRGPDEWTIRELAEHIGMPESTLYTWVQQGHLRCRLVPMGTRHAKLIHANPDTIAALKAVRATPAPWHRRPPRLTPPTDS